MLLRCNNFSEHKELWKIVISLLDYKQSLISTREKRASKIHGHERDQVDMPRDARGEPKNKVSGQIAPKKIRPQSLDDYSLVPLECHVSFESRATSVFQPLSYFQRLILLQSNIAASTSKLTKCPKSRRKSPAFKFTAVTSLLALY